MNASLKKEERVKSPTGDQLISERKSFEFLYNGTHARIYFSKEIGDCIVNAENGAFLACVDYIHKGMIKCYCYLFKKRMTVNIPVKKITFIKYI